MELSQIVEQSRTIYIFGVTDEGLPFIILPSKSKFNVDLPVEAHVKVEVKQLIAVLIIRLKQGRMRENIRALIYPNTDQLLNFTEAIGEKAQILISLMPPSHFRDLYIKIANEEDVDTEKYKAITFQIPVDRAESAKTLATLISYIDPQKAAEIEEIVREKQERELRYMNLTS